MNTAEVLFASLAAILVAWAGWVSMTVISNTNKINATQTMAKDMEDLKLLIAGLNRRFDTFIKQELDALKEMVEDNKNKQ